MSELPVPEKELEVIPLLDAYDLGAAGGINFSRNDSEVPGIYDYVLEMIITVPVEKRWKKRGVVVKTRRDDENYKLLVRKRYSKDQLISRRIMLQRADNDDKLKAAKFPYPHFSRSFFSNFDGIRLGEAEIKVDVSPAEVFNMIYGIFDYYLDIEREKLILFTIYTLGTYFYKLFPTFPYLYLFGATESGKTKTLSLFERLCFNAVATINLSPSALFRLVEVFGATLCIDESEYLKDSEKRSELQQLLYAGYKKDSGNVLRVEGDRTKNVKIFHVYSPKIMASINYPNDVLLTRCIVVNMKRGTNREKLNRTPSDDFLQVKDKIYLLVFNRFDEVYQLRDMDFQHELLVGREHELWRPLFVIAHWLKGHMPERAAEIENALVLMLEQDVMIKQSLRVDSDLITMIYCLLSNIHESGHVSLQTIRDFILDEYRTNDADYRNMSRYWTPERIGRQLSALGFKRSRQKGRTYYYIDLERLKALAQAYNVNVEENVSEASQSRL